jgi:subtilisin family serine protease
MRVRRLPAILLLLVVAGVVAATAGGGAPLLKAKPKLKPALSAKTIDLSTYNAKRWIVQLRGAPLASYRLAGPFFGPRNLTTNRAGRLTASSARGAAYMKRLKTTQQAFAHKLVRKVRGAKVQRGYQVVLNGLAVKMTAKQAAAVRLMPGVLAVTPDIPFRLQMYSTPAQIGAPTLWGQVGGQANAGAGVKVAVIDSGIFVRYDENGNYTGNPCFDDAGYTAPKGYPKGEKAYTNNKVIVARHYFRPGDPPTEGNEHSIQGPGSSPHGTHTAGTVACNANTSITYQGASLNISGVAPKAYLMNYKVFYPSETPEDFQNGNAYVAELVQAFEDAVKDGADVISNSWGSTYQNTLAWPDPMVQAAEAAVDAGVVVVFSNGNAGPDTDTVGSAAIADKVISVGAVTKPTIIVPGFITVTGPGTVPANLQNMPFAGAAFGPQMTSTVGPAVYVPAEDAIPGSAANESEGCPLADGSSPYPAGSLTGKIALIQRGTCEFGAKALAAERGGAMAVFIYNNALNGETIATMGAGLVGSQVTIPAWLLRRSDGLNMLAFEDANPGVAQAKFDYSPHTSPNPADVIAGFSSRGPTQDRFLKPDVVAPGVDVVSSGYAVGAFPAPFTGFGSASGTSMAAPHVAGASALLKQLHPDWTPAQVKSALMTTATEDVWTSTAQTTRAGVVVRGAGRIDLTKAGTPGLTLDLPSLSTGEIRAGQSKNFTIHATDVSGAASTWAVSAVKTGTAATIANFNITPSTASLAVAANGTATLGVDVSAIAAAAASSYEGKVELTNSATGRVLHVPVWLRVLPTVASTVDVLLVDDDGSSLDEDPFPDYSQVYKDTLTSLGVTYTYLDAWNQAFPSFNALFGYKAVLVFTGDNNSFNTSGFSTAALNRLAEWMDSGGKLWAVGQNLAETTDNNGSFSSAKLGRSRLYHGYLGVMQASPDAYGDAAAPQPTANGTGPAKKLKVDLSPGGDGAEQGSIEVTAPMPDNDTYQASNTVSALFVAKDDDVPGGKNGIAFTRASEPSLKEPRQEYLYRSLTMGFGLEGIDTTTSFATRVQVAQAAWRWLSDTITFGAVTVTAKKPGKDPTHVVLTASPSSSAGAEITKVRWDFGDGHGHPNAHDMKAEHNYKKAGDYVVRVEATDELGHTSIQTQTIHVG